MNNFTLILKGLLATSVFGIALGVSGPVFAKEPAKKSTKTSSAKKASSPRTPSTEIDVEIVPVDPDMDTKPYEDAGFDIRRPGEPQPYTEIPHPKVRDRIFKEAGLTAAELSEWDALDKDFLFVRARRNTLDELAELYPSLSKDKLKKLQELARAVTL